MQEPQNRTPGVAAWGFSTTAGVSDVRFGRFEGSCLYCWTVLAAALSGGAVGTRYDILLETWTLYLPFGEECRGIFRGRLRSRGGQGGAALESADSC